MYLVDTDILSESNKPRPNARIIAWMEEHESLMFVSALTLGEIHKGIELLTTGQRQKNLRKWFDELRRGFADSILPFDEAVALRWGALTAELHRRGRAMPAVDSFLAATALQHDLTIVTGNMKDFSGRGLKLFNPK